MPHVRRTWSPRGQTPVLRCHGRARKRINAISALTISPKGRRIGLYTRFHRNRPIRDDQVIAFLRLLLKHLRGRVVVLWDRINTHRSRKTQAFLNSVERLTAEFLPAYAPELNPVETFWGLLKVHRLGNHGLFDVSTLHRRLNYHNGRLRGDQRLLRGCVEHAGLSLD